MAMILFHVGAGICLVCIGILVGLRAGRHEERAAIARWYAGFATFLNRSGRTDEAEMMAAMRQLVETGTISREMWR